MMSMKLLNELNNLSKVLRFNSFKSFKLILLTNKEGVVEIWLTSEDTGAYGKDIGTSIVELLWKIVEHIPEGCRLR